MHSLPSFSRLNRFFLLSWLLLVLHVSTFTAARQYGDLRTALWTLSVTLTYSAFYLLPAFSLGHFVRWLAAKTVPSKAVSLGTAAFFIGSTALTHTLLFADYVIFSMYGFHINGFVVDLVLTPGGIVSLGASLGTQLTATVISLGLLALQAFCYFWLTPRFEALTSRFPRLKWRWFVAVLLSFSFGERLAYAYSAAADFGPIVFASERYPFYLPMTAHKLAKKLGIEDRALSGSGIEVKGDFLKYPLAPLVIEPPARPPNVVWLVAESLRFDMLDPQIMPRLWDFSQDALRLEKHYSGGNLTQMGVFSMFYGLYSTYWFSILDSRRSPVLMDVMQKENYQFGLYTSQRFTFPAFDKTIFVNMKPADMHERSGGGEPWQRDRTNIDEMLDFIGRRDANRPFMTYMFFESTHANYNFPPSCLYPCQVKKRTISVCDTRIGSALAANWPAADARRFG